MININDVIERNQRRPEPKEVTEIRENIVDTFSKLEFVDNVHKYFLPQDNGSKIELPSVSATAHQFEPYVDWNEKCAAKALKLGIPTECLKRKWFEQNHLATNLGTGVHLYGEMFMHFIQGHTEKICNVIKPQYEEGYLFPHSPKETAVMHYWEDLFQVDDIFPVMPETRVYMGVNDKFEINHPYAGTFDILLAMKHQGKWKLLLHDYKGLPLDTPILTSEGFKTMGELKEGDFVYDKDGKLTKILHCSEIHNKPCMKIHFNDNYSITCDEEHRWLISFLYGGYSKEGDLIKEQVMTTKELFVYVKNLNKNGRKHSYEIPKIYINKPLENNVNENCSLPIDPYVLGVWLGDGQSATSYVTNIHDDIFNEIERRGYYVGKNIIKNNHCGKAKTRCIFGLSTVLRKLNLINNKHIPDIYITNSTFEQRLDLLRGIMDTDGYYSPTRNRYMLTTNRYKQVEFCVKILTSLGIKPTIIKTKGYCGNCKNKKTFIKWGVTFATEIYPFLIRKINIRKSKSNLHSSRDILDVEIVESVPTRCIEVDSPTHTYLADKMLIVTHNTNADIYSNYARNLRETLLEPFTDFINEPKSLYTIQLNLYQLCLEQLGYEIIDRRLIWLKDDATYEKISLPNITQRLLKVI